MAIEEFKDAYSLEFLGLCHDHSESDLHGALLRNLGRFLTELGRDFCFVAKHPVQVGKQDFEIDLVFFQRGLRCLVAFELKVEKFKPADLGQLSFYVEALDRNVGSPTRALDRRAPLRDERRRGRRVRPRAHGVADDGRRVPDAPASQGAPRAKLHELCAQLVADARERLIATRRQRGSLRRPMRSRLPDR